jgi:hypothetical protein
MTHRQLYDKAKKLAWQHRIAVDILCSFERKKYGFEFAETDSDAIIDTINYGTDSYSFDEYKTEMKYFKDENLVENGKSSIIPYFRKDI